ncbi:MAG: hypothetical protein WBP56_23345 [Polyangia bacterium]
MTSDDSHSDARPATPDAGVQPEHPAGRRPPPAAPVIALRLEGLLTWTAERGLGLADPFGPQCGAIDYLDVGAALANNERTI